MNSVAMSSEHHYGATKGPIHRFRHRALLTEREAVEIYSMRQSCSNLAATPAALSKHYNVSPKAIRDIWNRRTWGPETEHLWTDERPTNQQIRARAYPSLSPTMADQPQPSYALWQQSLPQLKPNQRHATNSPTGQHATYRSCIESWPPHPSYFVVPPSIPEHDPFQPIPIAPLGPTRSPDADMQCARKSLSPLREAQNSFAQEAPPPLRTARTDGGAFAQSSGEPDSLPEGARSPGPVKKSFRGAPAARHTSPTADGGTHMDAAAFAAAAADDPFHSDWPHW